MVFHEDYPRKLFFIYTGNMQIIDSERIPIYSWCSHPEEGALQQARNLANHPHVFHHVALMPDTHEGYGMPIGGVAATRNVVIPNAVGVDIGCGMCAMKTSLRSIEKELVKKILGDIRAFIPVGFNKHKSSPGENLLPSIEGKEKKYPVVRKEWSNAEKSIGTLGGGNHFIEIQKGSDGYIWVMIHSGSRNVGLQIARHYNIIARKMNEDEGCQVPREWDLASLPADSDEGRAYLREMEWALEFAKANRFCMLERVKEICHDLTNCTFERPINIHHNYAAEETHFGAKVWVHRKGATSAGDGETGIIPGSQGTKSYIVRGKGNPLSFMSCSHGAGRKLGRHQAQRELDFEEEVKKLEEKGILHGIRGKRDLDEASGAYKDIGLVMKEQEDLVDIVVELNPLAVVKG